MNKTIYLDNRKYLNSDYIDIKKKIKLDFLKKKKLLSQVHQVDLVFT